MLLKKLISDVTIQGNVYISVWDDDDNELDTFFFEHQDNLQGTLNFADTEKYLLNLPVKYMFCPGDGYLHIELRKERRTR